MSKLTIPQRQSNQDDATYAKIVQNSIREQRPYLSDDDILSLAQAKISSAPSVQPTAQPKVQEVAKVEAPKPIKPAVEVVSKVVPKQVTPPKTLAEVARELANKKVVTDPMESGIVARQETIKKLPEQPAIMPSLGDPKVAAKVAKMYETFVGSPKQPQPPVELTGKDFATEKEQGYGYRNDGTLKGKGFLGELKMKDGSGDVATEMSIGVNINGKEIEIPTITPNLTQDEIDYLLKGNNVLDKSEKSERIIEKSIAFAKDRIKKGLSPFYEPIKQAQPTQVSEQPINQGLKPEKGVVIGGQAEDIRQQLLSKKTSPLETNQNPFAAPQKEVFTIEGIKEKISNLPKIRREEKVELPKIDIFDAEAEKQLPKGSPTEKAVYAKVLRDNDDKIKTFEASKVAAQMPTSDFEATINKKDLSFGNTQRASLMKAKFGGDMTAIEGSLNEYQETPEFKRDVIKAANGNKAKFNEAAQLVLDNKANEYAFAPTKLQKKMQQFSDWAASPDAGINNFDPIYLATKTLGAGLKGLTDVGAFGAALIGGTARSMGQVLDSKEVTMLDNFAAANAKAQKMSRGYIPQVQSEKASGLTQGLSDVTSIVAAIATPMAAIKPVTMFTKAKNFLSLGARGESAIAKGLSAEAQLAARATSGANKTLLEAAKTLQSKPANMVAQVLDNAATNWVIMGSSSFDGQRQKYLDMGFNEEQANRRAFGMTSLTNLLLAMPGVLRPHEASIAQKIFSTGSKKETLKASLKQAAYFGGDMTLLRGIEGTLDDNARREQGIKIENKPFIEVIKENGAKAIIDGGAGFVMGLMARGKYKQSDMQLNGIVEAFKNPEQLSLDVQKEVAKGRLSKEQAKIFQDFLTTIEPQYLKTLNETTDINGVQSPKYTPQTAVKIAIEKTKIQQATEALKNLNASVEKKTVYETDKKSGEIITKTVYRHKDGKLYETEETATKGRRASLLREKSTAEGRARRLEAGYNIENKLVSGWEMADLVDANSLNGKAKEGQREAIMANAPYEAVEVNVNDFAKQPEIAELVSQIESGKLDVTNVEENNIAPPTIDAEGNVIDGKKIVAKAIVESAFERGGGKITFMKPITNEAYTEAANEAFETKIGATAPKLTDKEGNPLPEHEEKGVIGMAGVFNKVIENGGDAAEGLVEAAKEGLQAFVEPQVVAERLTNIKGEDTFSEAIAEAAVNKAVKAEPIEAGAEIADIEKRRQEELNEIPLVPQAFDNSGKKQPIMVQREKEAEALTKKINAKYDAELAALEATKPTEAKTVEQLRAEEKAEMATIDPNDKEAAKEVYDRYDKLITPLLEKEKAVIKQEVENKRVETEGKIKRKDLFIGVGDFSKELGGSDKAAVPISHKEKNGIEFVEYAHPETGSVDVIVTGVSDNDFVGFYRIYENGKPTNKWSSKFENQSRNKENFKTMIGGIQEMLPQGHEYTEKTSISTDGLRVWNEQLNRGYELQYGSDGKLKTNKVAINGDAIVNDLGIDVEKGEFENIKVKSQAEFEKVRDKLLPYLEKFGLGKENIQWLTGTVKIDLPVLKKSAIEGKQEVVKADEKVAAAREKGIKDMSVAEKMRQKAKEAEVVEDVVEEELPSYKDGTYQIYKTKTKSVGEVKEFYSVPSIKNKESKGAGDSLHKTLEEAISKIEENVKDEAQEKEKKKIEDETKAKNEVLAKEKSEKNKDKTSAQIMADAKAEKVLDVKVRYSDGVMSRREFLNKQAKDGGYSEAKEIIDNKGLKPKKIEYRIFSNDNSFVTVSKTEFDYFNSIKQKGEGKQIAKTSEAIVEPKKDALIEKSLNDVQGGKTFYDVVGENDLTTDQSKELAKQLAESSNLPKKQFLKRDKIINDFDPNENIDVKPIEKAVKQGKSKSESIGIAVSKDDLRPNMQGVFNDAVNKKLVATDANKMIVISDPSIKETKIIDPKTGEVIDGRFPDYDAVIPKDNPIKRKVNVKEFLAQLNGLSETKKFFDTPIAGKIKIGEQEFVFNSELMRDVFQVMAEQGVTEVEFQLSQPNRALVVESNKGVMGIVMPLLLDKFFRGGSKIVHQSEMTIAEKNNAVQKEIDALENRRKSINNNLKEAVSKFRNANADNRKALEFDMEYHKERLAEIDAEIADGKSRLIDNPIQEQQDLVTIKTNIENGEITSQEATGYVAKPIKQTRKTKQSIEIAERKAESESEAELNEVVSEIDKLISGEIEEIEQPKSKLKEASSFIRNAADKFLEQHEKEINDPNAIQIQGGLSKKQIGIALKKLADIIDAVGDVEKAIKQFLDGIKDPKERTEYEREINNFFVEEYGEKEEVKPVPFAEIPKARVKEIMVEGNKVVDKTLENRLMTGETADSTKQEVKKKGLERVVDDFITAEANANNIVEKYGYNEALAMAIEGEIDGAARSAILGMEYLRRDDAVRVAKTATELRRATEDLAEWISYVGYLQAKGGSANAYWGKFYADNPNLGLTLKDKIDQWEQVSGKATPIDIREAYEKIDTQLKEALERVKELEAQAPTNEMMKAIKAIQEQEAKKSSKPTLTKEQRNRTSDKLMALAEKIRKSETSGLALSTPIPPHIISDSVKLLAQGVKVGEAIGDTMAKIYKLIEGGIKKKLTEEERKKVSDYFTAQLEESVETDNVSGNPITNSVIRDYVLQGFNTPKKLLEKLMEHYPNKSERNVRDLVSKYGQEITKTADEIDREISLIKNVFKTESQLEDIAQGIRPKKRVVPQALTFAERAAEEVRSAKKRRNLKNVLNALNKLNADLPALDNELRNKLDKQEATLSNKIKDLELAIEDGKEITKSEKTKLTSEEIERLELQLDETRKVYNEVFGKDVKSEKVPYSLDAVYNAIYENNKRLKGAQEDLEVVKKRGQDTSNIEADIERYSNNIETLSELRTGLEAIEAKRILQKLNSLAKRKEYYEQRKASGQYAKKPKNVLPETTELTKALSEVDRLKFEEQKLMYLAEKQAMSGTAKVGELISGIWNVPRLAMATGEWSFVGMQGRRLGASYLLKNPRVLKEAFKNAYKGFKSEEHIKELESRIKNSPEYYIYKSSGLDLTEQSFKTQANEEIAYNNIGKIFWRFLNAPSFIHEKIYKYKTGKDLGIIEEIDAVNPLLNFERSAIGYLNTLRFAAMTDMVSAFKQEGLSFDKNKEAYKAAAKYINTATGRGSIKGLESFAEPLAKFFFSPKMFVSEIQLGTTPLGAAYLLSMKDPTGIARREAFYHQLRYMSTLLGAGASATMLAYLKMGSTEDNEDGTGVEFNRASTNFGKIVFPNNRTVDFFNGAQRYVVVADRLFGQQKFKNTKGVIKDVNVKGSPSKLDIVMNIPKNKLNPALGFITGVADAQLRTLAGTEKYDDYGRVWDTEKEWEKLSSPIFFQMMANAYEQDPTILDGFGAAMAFFGKGYNVQEKEAPKPPKFKKRKSNYGFRYNP